jgi:SNF2 family DNA or RNA helicase
VCQVTELKKVMEPFLLRRLKSDVETKIPPKEETVIDVELTGVQKQYYRAIYERNTEFLVKGAKSRANAPNLMNIVMELRKARTWAFRLPRVPFL